MPENVAFIAIGANLPGPDGATPLQTCARALVALRAVDGLTSLVCSRWFSTAPVPVSDQPRYVNAMVRANCHLGAETLLGRLQAIEQAFGRARGLRDAARTLDLDIIDLGGEIRSTPDPILPHPRAHQRGFVLYPLRDVAPNWIHPVQSVSVDALIARLGVEDTRGLTPNKQSPHVNHCKP